MSRRTTSRGRHKRNDRGAKQRRVERLQARLADPNYKPAQVWVRGEWVKQ